MISIFFKLHSINLKIYVYFSRIDEENRKQSAAELKAQKDRSITNLRNKDRPSLQIYQPGKRRTGSSSTNDQDDPNDIKDSLSPEIESMETNDLEKTVSSTKSNNNRKRSDAKESSKVQNDERKKPSNEKRISRYSEKRNKAKEKRDVTENPVVAAECNSNSNEAEKCDEMS